MWGVYYLSKECIKIKIKIKRIECVNRLIGSLLKWIKHTTYRGNYPTDHNIVSYNKMLPHSVIYAGSVWLYFSIYGYIVPYVCLPLHVPSHV